MCTQINTEWIEWFFSFGENFFLNCSTQETCLKERDDITTPVAKSVWSPLDIYVDHQQDDDITALTEAEKGEQQSSFWRRRKRLAMGTGICLGLMATIGTFMAVLFFKVILPRWGGGASSSTFEPGNLAYNQYGIQLSKGLKVSLVAKSGAFVERIGGDRSSQRFHSLPDGAATFPLPEEKGGGFVYVSNSEADYGKGGVGAVHFDKDGNIKDYNMILDGTTRNCSGGVTPWNTWVRCLALFG
jgi:hypothetical protein